MHPIRLIRRARPAFLGAFLLFLTGCGVMLPATLIPKVYTWQEEALLLDGRKVLVERSLTYGTGRGVPGDRGLPLGSGTLRFKNPASSVGEPVEWGWEYPYRMSPMYLDSHDGAVYLVASIGNTVALGCPQPPYYFFRYASGKWTRIGPEAFPNALDGRAPNLLLAISAVTRDKEPLRFLGSDDVRQANRDVDHPPLTKVDVAFPGARVCGNPDPRLPEYLRIDR